MKTKKIVLYSIFVVCIIAVVVSAIGLGRELYTNWKSQSYYSNIASEMQAQPRTLSNPGGKRPAPAPVQPGDPVEPEDELLEVEDPWTPYMDFDALNEMFPGAQAWIKLEGTAIDYPVMLGTDNDYYLTHLPDGTRHRSGSIFLDFRNTFDFSDKSICVYGHESRTQDMFGSLKNYRDQEFYDAHPVIYLHTPQTDYALVLFAGYLLDSGREVPPMRFADDEEFLAHIANIKSRSIFKSDVEVFADDRIVNLCTCAYDFNNARWVIVGKLVEF